ncbi:cytochrome P450 [Daedalea quercina L-15889]|uniref:Cytochrome P450 n=1 Tax=Daedalea quercina L-15889 TaxID=1314783 RepID=A0A165TJA4_9APHY|nr:cytochrome P450 [Daedalea quercina L-15889]
MSIQLTVYASIGLVIAYVYVVHFFFVNRHRRMSNIPVVGGSSLPLLSSLGIIRSLSNAAGIIQEGYTKYKGRCFRYAEPGHWRVLVTSRMAVEELARAPEDVLSFPAAADDSIQVPYTLGPEIAHNPYHISILRTRLMRNAHRMFDDLRDEIVAAFSDEVQFRDISNEWAGIRSKDVALQVVCRAVNRVFVGLPVCRDPEYLAVNKGFTMNVVLSGALIKLFPSFMKPFIAKFCTNIPDSVSRVAGRLDCVITERLRVANEIKSDGTEHPNDLLQWLIESAPDGSERTVSALALRVLVVNFAALHTTSTMLTHAIYYLAAHPEHAATLREEVEGVIRDEGWSKASLGSMHLVDSFLREVSRVTGLVSMNRKALQDFTFSDGTFIPKGTFVAAASRAIHFDEDYYTNPDVFDPWRFASGGHGGKDHLSKTDDRFLVFGHGRHACPGRFFAATILKTMLAHVVTMYDVKFQDGPDARAIPPPSWISASMIPNRKVEVLFRKRRN